MTNPQLSRVQAVLAQGSFPAPDELRSLLADPECIDLLGQALDRRQQQQQAQREALAGAGAGSSSPDEHTALRVAGRRFMQNFLEPNPAE